MGALQLRTFLHIVPGAVAEVLHAAGRDDVIADALDLLQRTRAGSSTGPQTPWAISHASHYISLDIFIEDTFPAASKRFAIFSLSPTASGEVQQKLCLDQAAADTAHVGYARSMSQHTSTLAVPWPA